MSSEKVRLKKIAIFAQLMIAHPLGIAALLASPSFEDVTTTNDRITVAHPEVPDALTGSNQKIRKFGDL